MALCYMTDKLEKKSSLSNLRYSLVIYLEGLRKTMKTLNQDGQSPGLDIQSRCANHLTMISNVIRIC
jgi:hypothetical protein